MRIRNRSTPCDKMRRVGYCKECEEYKEVIDDMEFGTEYSAELDCGHFTDKSFPEGTQG